MASLKDSLYFSWNFDTITGSDSYGAYDVKDIMNDHDGIAHNFSADSSVFVFKEDLLTNKKVYLDTIDSEQTIQVLEEDDLKVDKIHKPSKLQLMVENSMYQVISDEMLNMFATIDGYAFKFNEPYNKYKDNYDKLEEMKKFFFSKINDKPNLERYIEFYKWLDSALGDMIDQFKPESANSSHGLKNTVESHILERNKYKHQLPLTIDSKNIYSSGITSVRSLKDGSRNGSVVGFKGTRTNSASFDAQNHSRQDNDVYIEDNLESVYIDNSTKNVNLQNILNKNYKKNYEFFQTAGKALNHQIESGSKSIFTTKFSSVDGLSDDNKILFDEYSVFNDTNQRAFFQRRKFNEEESKATPYATTASYSDVEYGKQGSNSRIISGALNLLYNTSNFIDNKFVQRQVPYTASNYHSSSIKPPEDLDNTMYIKIPNHRIMSTFRDGNVLIDANNEFYENSVDIVEPPITYNIPAKHKVNISSATEVVELYSPYNNYLDYISDRNINREKNYLTKTFSNNFSPSLVENTITFLVENNQNYFKINSKEITNIIFPRKDLIGLSRVRSRAGFSGEEETRYEETNSTTDDINLYRYLNSIRSFRGEQLPYYNDSFNNPYYKIRSFWRKEPGKRLRLTGYDSPIGTGSFNTYSFPSFFEAFPSITISNVSGAKDEDYIFGNYTSSLNVRIATSTGIKKSIYPMDGEVLYSLSATRIATGSDRLSISVDEMYGELAPYSHNYSNRILLTGPVTASNVYLKPTDARPAPKPAFVYNNFPPGYYDTASLYINLNTSYQVPVDCRINPGYNTYTDFFANIKHKSQTFSVIPEFNASNYEQLIKEDKTYFKKYLKRYGNETPSQLENGYEDFYADLNKFVDKKSNKIKIKLSGIKKLLPYSGFYPQSRTVQIAGIFNQEYLKETRYVTQLNKHSLQERVLTGEIIEGREEPSEFYESYPYYVSLHRTLAATQPLFMPGILFNSIKSGIGVSWPTNAMPISSSANPESQLPYGSKDSELIASSSWLVNNDLFNRIYNSYFYRIKSTINRESPWYSSTVESLTYNLPFETILDPAVEYSKMLNYVSQVYDVTLTSAEPYISRNELKGHYNFIPGSESNLTATEEGVYNFRAKTTILPYLDPSHYSNLFENTSGFFPFFSDTPRDQYLVKANLKTMTDYFKYTNGILYKSSINNFLAETTNFFLNKITNFSSFPEKEFFEVKSGSLYTMNIFIEKTENFSMFNKYNATSSLYNLPSASLFGPPVNELPLNLPLNQIYYSNDYYSPYTPPYFRAADKTKLKLTYTATSDGIPTLKNILDNLTISFSSSSYYGSLTVSEGILKQMQVKDVVYYDIIRDLNTREYDPVTGRRIAPEVDYGTSWVIQPKFECPLFTFEQCSTLTSGTLLQYNPFPYSEELYE